MSRILVSYFFGFDKHFKLEFRCHLPIFCNPITIYLNNYFPGVVTILDKVDYERARMYQLTVQATDGGKPPLSNQATVNVTVTDINDNPPIFIQNSYSALVNEAAQRNERLVQVRSARLY